MKMKVEKPVNKRQLSFIINKLEPDSTRHLSRISSNIQLSSSDRYVESEQNYFTQHYRQTKVYFSNFKCNDGSTKTKKLMT